MAHFLSPVDPKHIERIKDGLVEFFQSSSHDALKEASDVRIESTEIDIDLDVNERGLPCSELTVFVTADRTTRDYTIRIVLNSLRIARTEGCRSGNEYLAAIRYMIDTFFTRTNPIFEGMPIRRMYFEVEEDVATIQGLETLRVTKRMYDATTSVSKGEVVNGVDFYGMRLSKFFTDHNYNPGADPDVANFWSYVVRSDLPEVYEGGVRVSRLAEIVLTNTVGLSSIVHWLLRKIWYHGLLPLIIEPRHILRGNVPADYEDAHADPNDPDHIRTTIRFPPVRLGIMTLLSRDDFQTWYMYHLNLSPCDEEGGALDATDMNAAVRTLQETPFIDAVPAGFKPYFSMDRHATTKDVVLRCVANMRARRRLTYFEYLQLYLIDPEHNNHFEDVFTDYLNHVCRELR